MYCHKNDTALSWIACNERHIGCMRQIAKGMGHLCFDSGGLVCQASIGHVDHGADIGAGGIDQVPYIVQDVHCSSSGTSAWGCCAWKRNCRLCSVCTTQSRK